MADESATSADGAPVARRGPRPTVRFAPAPSGSSPIADRRLDGCAASFGASPFRPMLRPMAVPPLFTRASPGHGVPKCPYSVGGKGL